MTPDEKYVQILEKTNQQLSMAHNPYGIMVGILTILIAIVSIATAVVLFRQGRDYQSRLEKDRAEQKKKFDDFLETQMKIIKERNKTAKKLNEKVDLIIDEYKKQLEESSVSQKEEIQRAIDKLEAEKLSINAFEPTTVTPNQFSTTASILGLQKTCTCTNCGFGFYVDTSSNNYLTMGTTATCPKCGSVNMV